MPIVTAPSRGQSTGELVTEFLDTVGTVLTTYTYPLRQEKLSVRNESNGSIQVTVNSSVATLLPAATKEFYGSIDSFSIVSTGGVQSFRAVSTNNKEDNSKGVLNRWENTAIETFADVSNWSFTQRGVGGAATPWTFASGILSSPVGSVDTYATLNNVTLTDGRVQMIYENPDTSVGAGYVGIAVRGKAKNDLIGVIFNSGDKLIDCYIFPPSGPLGAPLASASLSNYPETTATLNIPMQLEVEIIGDLLKAWVNGKLMLNFKHVQLLNYAKGTICGIVANYPRSYQVSNFSVKKKLFNLFNPTNVSTGVAIGSSITFGSGSTPGHNNTNSWVRRFKDGWFTTLGNQITMFNAGIEGDTTAQMLSRFDADVLAYIPDFVIIEASPNDVRADMLATLDWNVTIDNLRKMIKKVKGAGSIPFLTSPTPININVSSSFNTAGAQKIPQYLARVRQLALEENIFLIDNNTAFNGYQTVNYYDGVHPNNTGHQLMADNALNTLIGKA